ncbi:MAG: dTDP-4-dehydrorhamnose reductase [Gammaproteobacteria bacterium]|nr:dTDP-4-dehydrorhamnose reductase [Gammaproteobacteria bacterium]
MKLLLIGNKGQVGREVEQSTETAGDLVYGFDIDAIDITNRKEVFDLFSKFSSVDVVINAAAYTAVDKAETDKELAYAVNRDAVENLALACKEYDLPLIHISTDYVFSGDKTSPYSEDDEVDPLGVYGKSKLQGEQLLFQSWDKAVVVRISWVFGRYGNNFVKTIVRLAKEREQLSVVRDQYGCPTPAADIARVLLHIARKIEAGCDRWGIYHYCGAPVTNWYQFARKIIDLASERVGLKIKQLNAITAAEYPTPAQRPMNSVLQVDKICHDYGIEQHDWMDYLKNVIAEIDL